MTKRKDNGFFIRSERNTKEQPVHPEREKLCGNANGIIKAKRLARPHTGKEIKAFEVQTVSFSNSSIGHKQKIFWKTVFSISAITVLLLLSGVFFRYAKAETRIGESVVFGHYPQTIQGDDETPVEWIVLTVQENRALLLSRYVLDKQMYNAEFEAVSWEECDLRSWLNQVFLNAAFTEKEQNAILLTRCENPVFSWSDVVKADTGKVTEREYYSIFSPPTEDRIFLLSCDEVERYLPTNIDRKARATFYVDPVMPDEAEWEENPWAGTCWWLRSSGSYPVTAGLVGHGGERRTVLVNYGRYEMPGVRPAVWVDLNKVELLAPPHK